MDDLIQITDKRQRQSPGLGHPDYARHVETEPYDQHAPQPISTEVQEQAVALWVKQQASAGWWAVQGAAQRGDIRQAQEIAARRGRLLADAARQGVVLPG